MAKSAKTRSREIPMMKARQEATASWVQDMHAHYASKGAYRAEDLRRVLGDPRESFGVESAQGATHSTRKL